MNPKKESPADKPGNETFKDEHNTNHGLISLFDGFCDYQPTETEVRILITMLRVGRWEKPIKKLRKLKTVNPKEYDREKRKLSFFTMAGTFSERKKSGFLKPSGFIILDIDGLQADQLSEIRARIESDQHTAICFLSPSGVGLKVAFRVSISNDAECKAAFAAISEYFRSKYQIELDPSGKDISRACFVSFDPAIYYNPDAVEFCYEVAASEPKPAAKIQAAPTSGKIERYVLSVINGELDRIVSAGRGAGNEALNVAAMKVAQLYHLGLFDKEPVKDHFINAYLSRGGSYKNQIEAANTFESGWNTGTREPRNITQECRP
jgi:hypothetical protein